MEGNSMLRLSRGAAILRGLTGRVGLLVLMVCCPMARNAEAG
jgi:hypothetical protein